MTETKRAAKTKEVKEYVALVHFADLTDKNYEYAPNDPFPRKGLEVSEDRIKELISAKNNMKRPVIKEK